MRKILLTILITLGAYSYADNSINNAEPDTSDIPTQPTSANSDKPRLIVVKPAPASTHTASIQQKSSSKKITKGKAGKKTTKNTSKSKKNTKNTATVKNTKSNQAKSKATKKIKRKKSSKN